MDECKLEFLDGLCDRMEDMEALNTAITRGATGTGKISIFSTKQLFSAFSMLHSEMREELEKHRRRKLSYALAYWKSCITEMSFVSPQPFDNIKKATLS